MGTSNAYFVEVTNKCQTEKIVIGSFRLMQQTTESKALCHSASLSPVFDDRKLSTKPTNSHDGQFFVWKSHVELMLTLQKTYTVISFDIHPHRSPRFEKSRFFQESDNLSNRKSIHSK